MLSLFKVFMSEDVDQPLLDVLHSGYITQGKKVAEFENELQRFFNYPYILTLNSATSGLTLALRMMNLQPGDEVLSTPLTCTATNWPILANNLKIRWVDVDPKTCNMDLDRLEESINANTKAIMLVHWAGNPIDLDRLNHEIDAAEKLYGHRIQVIEDCAHAFGAKYGDKFIGTSHGNYCVFSLQAIKHLTTGDGGLIFCPDKESYERAKLLRWYGIDREKRSKPGKDFRLENDVPEWGYKFHMNDINAVIGLHNLPHIPKLLEKVRSNAAFYRENLRDVPGVELLEDVKDTTSSSWIYTIKVADKSTFIPFMTDKNVMVSQVHNRNDGHTCVADFKADLPQLDELEHHIVSIPVGWWITDEDRSHIVDSICQWSATYYHVRHLEKKDCDQFKDLLEQLSGYRGECDWNATYEDLENTGTNIVVTCKNKIVAGGRLIVEPKLYDPLGHIEDIVVDKNYRKKGYGSIVVKALINLSREAGCYKTVLDCREELVRFYGKTGMVKTGANMTVRHT
jgi:dTDP-4-amino-4,6-dideoxygalactose transaminase/predicted GNAT family N-acyltransferase